MLFEVIALVLVVVLVNEVGVGFEIAATLFTDARRGELSMIFQFDVVRLDRQNWCKTDWTLPALKAAYARIDQAAGIHGWATSYLCNHDNPRAVSHFGDAA
jgi:oligo-1,6-glucosidase